MDRVIECAALFNWRASAAYRIGFAWSAAFAISVIFLGLGVFIAMHLAFERQLDATVSEDAAALATEYQSDGLEGLRSAIEEREGSRSPERLLYALFDEDGHRLLGKLQTKRPDLGIHNVDFVDPVEGQDQARGTAIDLSPKLRLLVAADREWIERLDETVLLMFGIAFAAICLMGIVGGVLVGAYLRKRLQTISQGAEAVVAGDRARRMPISSNYDEFDLVSVALNHMLDRIDMLLENLRQVSNDVAHDLRTPLTQLRNFMEASREAPTGTLVDQAVLRVDNLLLLFTSILRIAEVESGDTKRFFKQINLSVLLTDLFETYRPAVRDGGRELIWSVKEGVFIHGDDQLVAQAVANLLDNAQRHTPRGSAIRSTLVIGSEHVCIVVSDDGAGIRSQDRQRVIRRFERLDQSRSTPGFGLGLNLVNAVAELHGGQLHLGDCSPGLEATIKLPRL